MVMKLRGVLTGCVLAAAVLVVPGEASACRFLDHMFGWCGCGTARTTYSPPYAPAYGAAPACAPCAAPCPQTCTYVPQTCYRTVMRPVPVTACRPTVCTDPCSGCPVTTYRPITTWSYQSCLVPYTTYRAVYSRPYVVGCAPSVSACSPCGASGAMGCGVPSSGCSSCNVGAPSSAPVPTYAPPANGGTLPGPISSGTSGSGAANIPPSLGPASGSPTGGGSLSPIVDPNNSLPRSIQGTQMPVVPSATPPLWSRPGAPASPSPAKPAEPERTASRPVQQATYFQLLAPPPSPAPIYRVSGRTTAVDESYDGGWRPSRD